MTVRNIRLVVLLDEHALVEELAVRIEFLEDLHGLHVALVIFVELKTVEIGCYTEMLSESFEIHVSHHIVHVIKLVSTILVTTVAIFYVRASNE